ncbi:MAG: FAD-binding protein [Nocardioides sp.]|uniref:FAD-binding protein n=1 Tax=Nocardioides sp. TaxID=35761 RepID=UPI003F10549D
MSETNGLTLPDALPASVLDGVGPEDTFDVVVVGFGIAGACAALEAVRGGARTLILERAAVHGGTSVMSGGHFYLGGGTAVQKATGQDDTPEEMAKYLLANSSDPEVDKIEAYAHGSVEHFDWLESLGFEFERSYYPEKSVIQPGTQGLMYTGNEKVHPYRDQAVPAPRGHKVPVPGDLEGTKLVLDLLKDALEAEGVEVRYETGAINLVTDGDRVVGLAWRRFTETGHVRAGSVVLAAGGFVMNPDMVAAHTPNLGSKLFTLGSTYDDGLGIRMGASVGAELKHMDEAFITAPFYPPSQLVKGIVVNKRGERFVAEDSYHARTSYFVMQQPDQAAYVIVDSEHMEKPKFPLTPFIDGWETVEEMEEGLGLPAGSLVRTLGDYNEHARRGEDPQFHKHPDWVAPQDQGPWGAFDLSLGKALYAGFTLGGLRTSVDGEVLRADGTPVGGLYAAGACASNIAQDGNGYCSGTQLGEGSFFGRRAGRHAAAAGHAS